MKTIELLEAGRITELRAVDLLKAYASELEKRPTEKVRNIFCGVTVTKNSEKNIILVQVLDSDQLWRITDEAEISKVVHDVITNNAKLVDKIRRNPKHLTKLRALVIENSQKRIDLTVAEDSIRQQLYPKDIL